MKTYAVGTQITLTGTFRDGPGALIDPTTVTCEICLPDQTTLTPAATRVSQGIYTATYTPVFVGGVSPNGLHRYRFAGVGNAVVASEGNFLVESGFTS